MKGLKKCLILLVLALVLVCLLPVNVLADDDDFTFTAAASPSTLGTLGGEVEIKVTVTNAGPTNITAIGMAILTTPMYNTDGEGTSWSGIIAPGAKKTISWTVNYAAADLDRDIEMQVAINNDLDIFYDGSQFGSLRVASEDNVFRSGGGAEPEKDVYYVGETVTVTDSMRNSLAIEAADLTLSYYFKTASHGTTHGDPIDLGDVAGGATEEYSFDYTFTEEDIGNFRIGSEIAYYVSGLGPYKEYNIAHDFVVEPAPTPTPTPEPTPTPTPEPTPEATPTPAEAETASEIESVAPETTAASEDETDAVQSEPDETAGGENQLSSPSWLTIIIVVLAILLIAAVIVLVAVISKKSKNRDDFE